MIYLYYSHRPVDVHNVYNAVQVKLLMREDEFEDLPEYDAVFRDDGVGHCDISNFIKNFVWNIFCSVYFIFEAIICP